MLNTSSPTVPQSRYAADFPPPPPILTSSFFPAIEQGEGRKFCSGSDCLSPLDHACPAGSPEGASYASQGQGMSSQGFPGAGAGMAWPLFLAEWLPSWLSWRFCQLPNIVEIPFLLKPARVHSVFTVAQQNTFKIHEQCCHWRFQLKSQAFIYTSFRLFSICPITSFWDLHAYQLTGLLLKMILFTETSNTWKSSLLPRTEFREN